MYYQGLRDLNFPIDFHQVLRATTLRYRCSHLSSASETPLPTILSHSNQLRGEYFKVRHQEEEEEVEYEGLYVDSDDDEDVLVHYSSPKSEQSSKEEEDEEGKEHQNETWSLVEVAPFLGGRTAHNGNEGDSLFQMGAASIVPGVLNMIESLGGNNTHTYSNYHNHHLDRYLFARKKKQQ